MTWWMIVLLIFAVLFLIGCIPVGADVLYLDGALTLKAKLGPFWLKLIPRPEKHRAPKSKKEKKPAAKKQADTAEPKEKKPSPLLSGGVSGILELLRFAGDVLGELRRKLRLDDLMLRVRFGAGDDAAKTAIQYGRAWAAIGAVMPCLERIFVIKKRDIGAELDYNEKEKMRVDAHLLITITIGRALALAVYAGVRFLKLYNGMKKGGAVHESSPE